MWVLLGYLLITTALVPVVGRLADMFGRKRLYVAGFAVFTLGSLLAGLAQPQFHGWDLVAYRVVQGVGGALLITNSTAIVADAFRHGRVGLGPRRQPGRRRGRVPARPGGRRSADRHLLALGVPDQRAARHLRHALGHLAPARAGPPARPPALRLAGQPDLRRRAGQPAAGAVADGVPDAADDGRLRAVRGRGGRPGRLRRRRAARRAADARPAACSSDRLFAFASLAGGLERPGARRGAVRADLLPAGPVRPGPAHGRADDDARSARRSCWSGPLAGYLSDHYGSRVLATAGLLVSAVGLLGLEHGHGRPRRTGCSRSTWR